MKKILIVGGGGHAKVVASILNKHQEWTPVGYTDPVNRGPLLGLPYLGTDESIPSIISKLSLSAAAIGLGQLTEFTIRKELVARVQSLGLNLPPIISPDAIVNEMVKIGLGAIIMDGVILQPDVEIGHFSIINTGSSVDHGCKIGEYTFIAPGVTLSADVKLGKSVFIGTGTCVIQGVVITDNTTIGSGAVVANNIEQNGTYIGVPAKRID
jgi:sugar O-acyltransferase (sialic acid O-acetyltransferase NeuD family)